MEANAWIDQAEHAILHTYNRYQIILERGEGVYLYDTEGKSIWTLRQELQCRPWDMGIKSTMTL